MKSKNISPVAAFLYSCRLISISLTIPLIVCLSLTKEIKNNFACGGHSLLLKAYFYFAHYQKFLRVPKKLVSSTDGYQINWSPHWGPKKFRLATLAVTYSILPNI